MTPERQEALLLAQQRRGWSRLQFVEVLADAFIEHRVQRIRRRLLLIISTAVLFQLIYSVLDLLLLPPKASLATLPVRIFGIVGALLAFIYCRRTSSPARLALLAYVAAYTLNGACIAVIIHLCWNQGVEMAYDGLFLVLLFGYVLLGVSFRAVSVASWGVCALFFLLGMLLANGSVAVGYQGLFLLCANVIGSVGAYLQEHGQRGAWLNLCLLDLARQRAEADDARKLRLLAAASHDLRQPLNAMGLYAQHLLEQNQDPGVHRISSRLAIAVEQLSRLLQSLFDYTRLTLPGGVQAKPEVFALRPLLLCLSSEARAEAVAEGVELQLHCPELWVRSDPVLLERMLRNLLSNALRHAQARHVWLLARLEEGAVYLEVGDDGKGLDEHEQAQVFEEFRQLDNPGRNAERGLGLAIVQQLAELLTHDLRLYSSPGGGARFVLQLPQAEAGQVPAAKPVVNALAGRVLLLEDDAAGREALCGLLQRWGCEV
jgi:signal transduction histidine kinase